MNHRTLVPEFGPAAQGGGHWGAAAAAAAAAGEVPGRRS